MTQTERFGGIGMGSTLWKLFQPAILDLVKALLPYILQKLADQQKTTPDGVLAVNEVKTKNVKKLIEEAIAEYEASQTA